MAIVVANMGDVRPDGGADAELFVEFAGKGLLRAFSLFDFSTGKFPLKCHGLVGAALANQHEAVAHQQSGNDEAKCGSRRARVGNGLRVFHAFSVNAR